MTSVCFYCSSPVKFKADTSVCTATGTTACWRSIHRTGLRRWHWHWHWHWRWRWLSQSVRLQPARPWGSGWRAHEARAHPARAAQTPSAHPVGGADRPHLRGVPAAVPDLRRILRSISASVGEARQQRFDTARQGCVRHCQKLCLATARSKPRRLAARQWVSMVPCLEITEANGQTRWLQDSGAIVAYVRERFATPTA